MIRTITLIMFFLQAGFIFSARSTAIPLHGDLNLELSRVWEIEDAGEALFARIRDLRATDDRVYIYDRKNMRVYIVGADGKPIGAFGKRGEGPGEMLELHMARMFLVKNKIVMAEHGRLHFFDGDGRFLYKKQVPLNRAPLLFLNENEYITAPTILRQAPSGHGAIRRFRLEPRRETVLFEFDLFKGGYVDRPNGKRTYYNIKALIPMMVVGRHGDRLFFGMNDRYRIQVSDLEGRIFGQLELDREAKQVTSRELEAKLVDSGKRYFQQEMMRRLVRTLPNHINHFGKVEVHNGLVYVFNLEMDAGDTHRIDIFSPEGRYLYNARIKVPGNPAGTSLPVICGDSAYIVQTNEEGDPSVARYRITLPQAPSPPSK